MSGTGTGSRTGEGFAGLVKAIQALKEAGGPTRLFTKRQAAKKLGVTAQRLRAMLFLGRLTRVRVRGRELIFL